MDYTKHYNLLIEKAKTRPPLDCYVERHHIIPKCMGGRETKANMVALTPEEHYVAHQLLYKMYPNIRGLFAAITMMCNGTDAAVRNNKMYGWIRRKHAATFNAAICKDTIWINNGIEQKRIKGSIPDGWVKGRFKFTKEHITKMTAHMSTNNPMNNVVSRIKVAQSKLGKKRPFARRQGLLNK